MLKVKTLNAISTIIFSQLSENDYEVGNDVVDPDAILVRSADCHDLEINDNLLCVARAGVGVNNIPIDRCTEHGVVVFNTPGANANAVKELVIASMFMVSRNMVQAMDWVQTLKGQGDAVGGLIEKGKKQFVGPELKGKRLGVVGLGAIGAMVANAAAALDMEVMGYDPFISIDSAWGLSANVKRAISLEALVSTCDYVTMHVPLLEKTRDFFSEEVFRRMKPGSVLLNFSRGEIVNKDDLLAALNNGGMAKYITDFPSDEMLGHPKIIAIPHLGASTPESEENCASMAAKEIKDYIEKGNIVNSVNMPECMLPSLSKYRLSVLHKNIKNMVGQFTTVLSDHNINIADMINKSRGELAYTLFGLDDELPRAGLERIREIEGVVRVRRM